MNYISIGAVTKPSTEYIVMVSHCGYDYTLTGELARLWLNGRFAFDAARNQIQQQALNQLMRMGLVIVAEDAPEGAYRALTIPSSITSLKTRWNMPPGVSTL